MRTVHAPYMPDGGADVKTKRKEVRLDPNSEALIEQAAHMLSTSPSSFMVDAAVSQAERVLARSDYTLMPAEQFDALVSSLDLADKAPALARLASQPRRFTRV